jgi:hypothetical protein
MATKVLFLPLLDDIDVDTTLEYIHRILIEIFDMSSDNVVVELETLQGTDEMAVSVIFDETWRCQIYVNDNVQQVQLESANWINLYGANLSHDARQDILACQRRFDLYPDPDEEHIYDIKFDVLTDYLQRNYSSRYSFNLTQHVFVENQI